MIDIQLILYDNKMKDLKKNLKLTNVNNLQYKTLH